MKPALPRAVIEPLCHWAKLVPSFFPMEGENAGGVEKPLHRPFRLSLTRGRKQTFARGLAPEQVRVSLI
jgi:hypothetical protein